MSYKEQRILLSLVLTLCLAGYYLSGMFSLLSMSQFHYASFSSLLLNSVFGFMVITIVSQIILAVINHKEADEKDDERDKLILLRASYLGYVVISVGLIIAIAQSQLNLFMPFWGESLENFPHLAVVVSLMFVSFLLAETVKYTAQFLYYRKGFIHV